MTHKYLNVNARNLAKEQDVPAAQNTGMGQVHSKFIVQNVMQAITNAME